MHDNKTGSIVVISASVCEFCSNWANSWFLIKHIKSLVCYINYHNSKYMYMVYDHYVFKPFVFTQS